MQDKKLSNRIHLENLLPGIFRKRKTKPWVMLILNPAAGQGTPDLRAFNRVVRAAGYEWEVEVTNQWGDGAKLARKAVSEGARVVAVYGGDGTVMDVASGLMGGDVPLGILPGGTGNALAKELNLPFDVAAAAARMVSEQPPIRPIDLGMVNQHLFCLRLGVGLEADITRTADRSLKDRMGPFAYLSAAIQAWNNSPISMYQLEMDGKVEEIEGLACMVANAGTLGIPGLGLSSEVKIDDGLLDVFVIRRADLNELATLAASVMGASGPSIDSLPHWQCREINIQAEPQQPFEADGEELGETPVRVSVLPKAVNVVALMEG